VATRGSVAAGNNPSQALGEGISMVDASEAVNGMREVHVCCGIAMQRMLFEVDCNMGTVQIRYSVNKVQYKLMKDL
jgi:hypothetical protein